MSDTIKETLQAWGSLGTIPLLGAILGFLIWNESKHAERALDIYEQGSENIAAIGKAQAVSHSRYLDLVEKQTDMLEELIRHIREQ